MHSEPSETFLPIQQQEAALFLSAEGGTGGVGRGGEVWSAEGESDESQRKSSKIDRKTKISHSARVLLDFLPLNTVPTDSYLT